MDLVKYDEKVSGMGKQSLEEKEFLIELMCDLRTRTGKKTPKLANDLKKLGCRNFTINTLRNDFFGHPERSSSYDAELVLKIIEVYYHYVVDVEEQSRITLLEAVLILTWTHMSLATYSQLAEVFRRPHAEITKVMAYIMECEQHDLTWLTHGRILHNYLPLYLAGSPARPWDGVQEETQNGDIQSYLLPIEVRPVNGFTYEQTKWAEALLDDGKGYEAEAILDPVIAETFENKRLIQWSEAMHLKARIQMQQARYPEAEVTLQDALETASASLKKQMRANLGASLYYRGEYQDAAKSLSLLKNDLSPRDDMPVYVFTLNTLGAIAAETWNFDYAKHCYHEALKISSKVETPLRTAFLHMALGNVYRYQADYFKSDMEYQSALQAANQVNLPELHAELLWQKSIAQASTNQLDLAENTVLEALDIANSHQINGIQIWSHIELARLNFRCETYPQACETLSEMYYRARRMKNKDLIARTLYALATIAIVQRKGLNTVVSSAKEGIKFLKTYLPSDIFDDAVQTNLNTLHIRRAQVYFWQGILDDVPSDPLNVTEALFGWLRPLNELPPGF